ncbi:MAG: formylglycine-generating enzyme family protein [Deltaproteobacteria bacterium]|nr:formylglycine-generating enzyme family protein [Deltaproteobacteria bacterium]MBN2671341.1 formylglycine-generating enzyme family protein [Deltaproteobacteria bacterium]
MNCNMLTAREIEAVGLAVLLIGTMACNNRVNDSIQRDSETDTSSVSVTDSNTDTLFDSDTSPPRGVAWKTIRAGNFVFGSPEDRPCRAAYAEDEVNVTLTRDFLMAETEVTQHQWIQAGLELPQQYVESPNLPVVFVNFYEAAAYCNALSTKEGFEECYDLTACEGEFAGSGNVNEPDYSNVRCVEEPLCANEPDMYRCAGEIHKFDNWYDCPGYRLPTTAEWEYAARAGTTTDTYVGDLQEEPKSLCRDQANLNDIAWYCFNSGDRLHTVGRKQQNAWGLYDVIGNAMEWVDYFTDGESLDFMDGHPGEDLVDPIGRKEGHSKDLRGGRYCGIGCVTRSAWQFPEDETARREDATLRPVRTLFNK